MSPDDIFAAQFWPWPDPAIKRDAQGRVLFVNAAFLSLYGGRVEDWRGNAVGGWPAPQAPTPQGVTAPYRFETRIAGTDGSEQVYDWMEQTLADGNAFALARNVTVFIQLPDPDPAQSIEPEPQFTAPPQQQFTPPAEQAPAYHPELTQAALPEQTFEAPVFADAPHQEFEASEFTATEFAAPEIEDTPYLETQQSAIEVPEIAIPQIEIPSDDAYAMTESHQEPAPAQTMEREFERRPLPIEDESAVLGNNWRDAVIAKAVGAEEVTAPVAETVAVETASQTPDLQPQSGGDKIRILLAEDNAINALLTRTLLEAEGHSVDTVEDGALAVEAMKQSRYDLIFMDMRMPNMDGLEATRKIRTLPNISRALPIIALTANAFDDDRNACFDSGMNDFMTKPVSAEELSEKVRDWTSDEAKARMMQAA